MSKQAKKLLITGGLGFIGSNFIRYLINKYPNYQIINLDIQNYAGNLENLKNIESDPNYTFIRGDICDDDLVGRIIKDVDCIVNFAAQTHVDRSISDASDFIKTNIYGTYVLLEAARRNNIQKYIQISSDEVYGSIDEGSFTEESPLKPNSPYAASKASADLLCRSYYITHKLPNIVIRSSNNFGPYQFPEKIIPLFVTNILQNKKVPLYGDGRNIRDWLHVEDNCSAIDLIMHNGKIGEVYNVGGGNEITNLELVHLILKKLNKPDSFIEFVKDRPGHDLRYSIDSSKVKRLGWQSQYSFNKALDMTVDWYLNNRDWWKRLKGD